MNYISKEDLQELVNTSGSRRECLRKLGIHEKSSSSYKFIKYYLDLYNISITHFTEFDPSKRQIKTTIPLVDILSGSHPFIQISRLKKRLIKENIFDHRCSMCNLTEWNNLPIPLDLDHINGIPTDHRIENLRLLCRNCHAQTSNFCGMNKKKKIKPLKENKIYSHKSGALSQKIKDDIELVNSCDIDFKKFGWVTKLAILLNKHPQKINKWLKKYMPEILDTAFQKSSKNLAASLGVEPSMAIKPVESKATPSAVWV